MRLYARGLVSALSLAVCLAGCENGQRSLPAIRQSAEHAMYIKDYEKAVSEYGEIIQRRPEMYRDRLGQAQAYLAMGKPAEAREQLEIAYTIRPNDADVIDLLARAMLESGDLTSLAGELRANAEAKNRVWDWLLFGRYMFFAGDHDEAEKALLTAARLDRGQSVHPQLSLAELYQRAGDDAKALDRYRMALYLAPDDEKINNAIRAMGEVPGPTFALRPAEQGG